MPLSRENPLVAFYLERGTIKFFRSKTLTHYSECPIVGGNSSFSEKVKS